jgi:transcriptional regulator with XRE-family HTH domain
MENPQQDATFLHPVRAGGSRESGLKPQARDLLSEAARMVDREQFGVRLRREREKRGISLDTLAAATNVSVDLWVGLEQNDLSRWPAGIFARAFVRDYARAIGLDADAVVDEFCRQYPLADRRTGRIVQAQAELIGHRVEGIEAAEPLPGGRERRKTPRAELAQGAPPPAVVYTPRVLAATIDAACICGCGLVGATAFGTGFLASAGLVALVYFSTTTILGGASPGTRFVDALRHRAPSLFTSRGAVSA